MTPTRAELLQIALRKENDRVGREWDAFLLRHEDHKSEAAQAEACDLGVRQAQRWNAIEVKICPWLSK